MRYFMTLNKHLLLLLLGAVCLCQRVSAQSDTTAEMTLQSCIAYALSNQAAVQQALLDEEIGEREIASALSAWFPQINASGVYNYNAIIPTAVIGEQVIRMGQSHTAGFTLQADQQILNPALIQASRSARHIRQLNDQQTENVRIRTVVEVSKAYYSVLTSEEQIRIVEENIQRLDQQLQDAQARYTTGLVDITDFKRAQIALSNAQADLKRTDEALNFKYAYLKELMGMSGSQKLELAFEVGSMEQEVLLDTMVLKPDFTNRVEYQMLQTQKQLQGINTQYNRLLFLPTLSAFYNYGWDFRNNELAQMLNIDYPRSTFGLNLQLPIFQGTRRIQETRRSVLLEKRLDWDIINLQNQINTQYETAMATYKSNLNDWKTAKANVELSEEVYEIIKLQYDAGIKTYLDLMTAETDLRTTQVNYLNALYNLLSGKLDVQQAIGVIETDY